MPERAEIEAVGEAMDAWLFAVHGKVSSLRASEVGAADVIEALDRVRDARGNDEGIAVCQNPNGEGLYVPAKDIRDGRCFEVDCDCTPRVYVPVDEGGN